MLDNNALRVLSVANRELQYTVGTIDDGIRFQPNRMLVSIRTATDDKVEANVYEALWQNKEGEQRCACTDATDRVSSAATLI